MSDRERKQQSADADEPVTGLPKAEVTTAGRGAALNVRGQIVASWTSGEKTLPLDVGNVIVDRSGARTFVVRGVPIEDPSDGENKWLDFSVVLDYEDLAGHPYQTVLIFRDPTGGSGVANATGWSYPLSLTRVRDRDQSWGLAESAA